MYTCTDHDLFHRTRGGSSACKRAQSAHVHKHLTTYFPIAVPLLLLEGKQRVSPFYHPSIHQISTLEKTKLCHRPILSSLLSTSSQQIADGGLARDLRPRPTTGFTVLS